MLSKKIGQKNNKKASSTDENHKKRLFLKDYWFLFKSYLIHNWWVTYVIAGTAFIVFSLILGSSNLIYQGQLSAKINRLKHKLEYAKKDFYKDSLYLERRRNSSDFEIEQIAREQYLFKEPNELIFVLQDTAKYKK